MGAAFPPYAAPTAVSPCPVASPETAIATRRRPVAREAEVGPRQPCPCGSGRRYKNCHGADGRAALTLEPRPFAGLPGEPEWVALREIVPAATFEARLRDHPDRTVVVATVLPMAWPAMVRTDGAVFLGLQVGARSGDASRDLAVALEEALDALPGSSVTPAGLPAPGRRLQDLIADDPIDVHVHAGFDFWLEGSGAVDDEVQASLERANTAVVPTTRLSGVEAAYWCRMPARNHLRWVLPYDEEPALDALARLFAADGLTLGDGTRYIGSFRAHGLVVPVWDLASSVDVDALEAPTSRLVQRLDEAAADRRPLRDDELRARRALAGRQVTIR